MKESPLLFIAGVPAVGKSTFGRWLESQQGFLHIDDEENSRLDELGLHELWEDCLGSMDCAAFGCAQRQLNRPVVFNWGFPVEFLAIVPAPKQAGFGCWWFDADVEQARRAFIASGKELGDFVRQVAAINASRAEILAEFRPNVLVTLGRDGGRRSPEETWAAVQSASPLAR